MCSKRNKDRDVKAFDMVTNKNEAKTMRKHIHLIINANSIAQHVIQIKNEMMKHVNAKIVISAKKIIVGILVYVFVRIENI